jgi:hypothetical protein
VKILVVEQRHEDLRQVALDQRLRTCAVMERIAVIGALVRIYTLARGVKLL